MESFDFVRLRPHHEVVKAGLAEDVDVRVMAEPGRAYAMFVDGGGPRERFGVVLPGGRYHEKWINTKTGKVLASETLTHEAGQKTLQSPEYEEDIALGIRQV
jgi:hypothetical protein